MIKKLLSLKNPFSCPHGRPTIIEMTQYELEKKFKQNTIGDVMKNRLSL